MKHLALITAALTLSATFASAMVGPGPAGVAAESSGAIHLAAMGDDPATKHRGGHRRGGKSTAAVSATTPDLKGTSREDADKAYRKKYGF